jgi:hypothetical protein
MSLFGDALLEYRKSSIDPDSGRKLSQERLGELIGVELGMAGGYSGAAISDWEHGKSKIQADDRSTLISLIKVLFKRGGLKTITEADKLLEAGNYRALNLDEKKQIFPQAMIDAQINSPINQKHPRLIAFLQEQVLDGILGEKTKIRLVEAREGPQPAWPRQVVTLVNGLTEEWSVFHTLRLLAWVWIWLLSSWLILPSLRWPFANQDEALVAMVMYGAGTLMLPVFIGALTTTKNNPFWRGSHQAKDYMIRLYTYQGAGIGFYLSYMAIFALNLIVYYVRLNLLIQGSLEVIEITCLLIITYGCARLVPYNLWKAFKRLDLADGGIFFIFLVLGPLWGGVFYILYPLFLDPFAGLVMILSALTLIALMEARQHKLTGKTVIPVHWHVLFYGFVVVLYEVTIGKNLFDIVALAGIVVTLSTLLALNRIHYTLQGMIVVPLTLYFSTFVLQWYLWVGLIVLVIVLLAWWLWGKKYLSLQLVFWEVILTLAGCLWLWRQQWLTEIGASIAFGVITTLLLLWDRKSIV